MPSEQVLSDVLSEFARTMVTDFPIQGILDQLVRRIVDVMPITGAGVTLISPGTKPRYVAASSRSALRFEQLQTELGEGPCLAAYQTGQAVACADLRAEERFPRFVPRAVADGLAAVFTFPLRHGNHQLGALDLYRDFPGRLDAATMVAAQTLADVASAYVLNAQARADLEDSSERSRHLLLHDDLTGLPNRALLIERLEHALERGRRSGKSAAVLFVDLDGFKAVNDRYGHQLGDELLVAVARRLGAHLRAGDTLARLHGDEFVILCEDLGSGLEADTIAERASDEFDRPFSLAGAEVVLSASIGVAFAGRADRMPEALLDQADKAMYEAKRMGGGRHLVVDLGVPHPDEDTVRTRVELYRALRSNELRVAYQPIVSAADGRMVGVEALLRWEHPRRGLLPPAHVIPAAEDCGVIVDVGRWVLQQACKDLHSWPVATEDGRNGVGPARTNTPDDGRADRDRGDGDRGDGGGGGDRWADGRAGSARADAVRSGVTLAVNVSAAQLFEPGFLASVAEVLVATETRPELVTLEVTDSVFVHDSDRALDVLNNLGSLGVRLALGHFGSGSSSIGYLRKFPVDAVKIDQEFVADLGADPAALTIVSAIVLLAHALGLSVVAGGVETAEQFRELAALGCDACQGSYFAAPMPAAAIASLIAEGATPPVLPVIGAA